VRFVFFCHSLVSDWNHANAHFLRGVTSQLLATGHDVCVLESADNWSLRQLREQCGEGALKAFYATYPQLKSTFYDPLSLSLDDTLKDADVVVVHDRNHPALISRVGRHHRQAGSAYRLLFQDARHHATLASDDPRATLLEDYDGVLTSSDALKRSYEAFGWARKVWTWHEAADTRVFQPAAESGVRSLDVVWAGNWGNGEQASGLTEFLIEPVRMLGLHARIYGSGYPEKALRQLRAVGIDYSGWLANFCLPTMFAMGRVTVNVPRSLRRDGLVPTVPTMRVFEALACRIPLVTAPWDDLDGMFRPGYDFLVAHDCKEMQRHLTELLADADYAQQIAEQGYQTVLAKHTCAHRVEELLAICNSLGVNEQRVRPETQVVQPRVAAVAPQVSNWF